MVMGRKEDSDLHILKYKSYHEGAIESFVTKLNQDNMFFWEVFWWEAFYP